MFEHLVMHGLSPTTVLFGYPNKHQLMAYLKLSVAGRNRSEVRGCWEIVGKTGSTNWRTHIKPTANQSDSRPDPRNRSLAGR